MLHFLKYGAISARLKAVIITISLTCPVYAESVNVLMLGDSLTHGYGLAPEAGLVPRLEAWLQGHNDDVELVNGGVSGDTTAGGLARIAWLLTPDLDAIVIELGANDALRGIAVDHVVENLNGIVEIAREQELPVLLLRVPAPGNFGQAYKQSFDGAYEALAEQDRVDLIGNFFFSLADKSPSELNQFMQNDGIHPNSEGVSLIVEDLGPKVLSFLKSENLM